MRESSFSMPRIEVKSGVAAPSWAPQGTVEPIPPSPFFTTENIPKIFSLGFRCSSAAILKRMGLKHESFPFDWLISRLSVIRHCMETDFTEFLNLSNYQRKYSNTYEMADSRSGFICDEHLMVNLYYQPVDQPDPENTYKWYLAMNHHNILEQKDTEYYERCVQRYRELMTFDEPKIYLHICPLITLEKYNTTKENIFHELTSFDNFIYNFTNGTSLGLFFIMVRDDTGEHSKNSGLFFTSLKTNTKIYIIYTNNQFIDAGESFMGNCHEEREYIEQVIRKEI